MAATTAVVVVIAAVVVVVVAVSLFCVSLGISTLRLGFLPLALL